LAQPDTGVAKLAGAEINAKTLKARTQILLLQIIVAPVQGRLFYSKEWDGKRYLRVVFSFFGFRKPFFIQSSRNLSLSPQIPTPADREKATRKIPKRRIC